MAVREVLAQLILIGALEVAGVPGIAAAHAAECDVIDLNLTTTPVTPQLNYALHRHIDLMEELPGGPIDLMLVGDSLVESWDPLSWGEAAKGKSIFNFGSGGERTQNLLWRLQSDKLKELQPRNVVLLIGTNNLGVDDLPCATLAGIDAAVQRMRELWHEFRLLVVLIPPRGESWKFQDEKRREINQGLRQRAASQGWETVDVDAALTCNFTQPCANYQWDKLHLEKPGYKVLAGAVLGKLGWQLGGGDRSGHPDPSPEDPPAKRSQRRLDAFVQQGAGNEAGR
jgi:lysophospholipase L1-like esterase